MLCNGEHPEWLLLPAKNNWYLMKSMQPRDGTCQVQQSCGFCSEFTFLTASVHRPTCSKFEFLDLTRSQSLQAQHQAAPLRNQAATRQPRQPRQGRQGRQGRQRRQPPPTACTKTLVHRVDYCHSLMVAKACENGHQMCQ